ncbi:hypothetical protein EMWEY_00057600 [Eimeria maxima]|uniref:Uncharacterized protein n=1 Tax=Eimeria maxima TaxID=5804 RepID=U6M604_EIMMA|nr:hypothetical protein EMWEY_00057600 [Eimeria maxima]CDJ59466.1 hypothetical protein EMWEY_00057600 [Eimeria maxima]
MYESAADFERKWAPTSEGMQGEELLRPAKVARLNEPSSSTYHPQMSVEVFESDISGVALGQPVDPLDADAWETTYPELGFDEGKQQQHLPKPTEVSLVEQGPSPFPVSWPSTYEAKANASHVDSVPVEPAISDEDFRCLQAWLEDLMRKGGLQTIEPVSVNTVQTSPVVEEQSAAAANGSPVRASRVFGGESTIGIAHSDKDQGVAVLATQKEPVKALEQPATSVDVDLNISHKSASATALEAIGSRGDERCDPGDIRLHPFVRLPVVKQEDVRRTFRVEYAVSPEFGRPSPMESFMTMRNLFAKASLTAEEVDRLLLEAETLASYALDRLSRHHNKHTAKYIFVKLSSVFMVFDSLICTIEVLGEKMNASKWWPHFVQNFSTEYYFTEVGKTEQLNRLVNRLSSALAIYKTGNRPPLQEVIDLKRTIITEAHKGSQMSHPLWKLWLQDDKEFSCPSCGTESPSDV